MITIRLTTAMAAIAVTVTVAANATDASPAPGYLRSQDTVSFASDILPIFEQHCWECHGGKDENGEIFAEEELHLTSYEGVMAGSTAGSVIEPGDVAGSFLYEMVEFGDMPSERDPLSPEKLALIKSWIEAGAPNN